jgi:hypothetical protein
MFDIDADGRPERVAWTRSGSDVAFLARDVNGNGIIDNGSELFGTATMKSNGQRATNGFDALLDLDGGPEMSDGKLEESDAVFSEIVLWYDANHDGVSQPSELVRAADGGIRTLFTTYWESRRVDRNGNSYRYAGAAIVQVDNQVSRRRLFDVFPQVIR